jgi:hypothetical protein
MPETGQLSNLLARYLDLRSRGELVAIDELCRDAPELREELRREIALMEAAPATTIQAQSSVHAETRDNGPTGPTQPSGTGLGGYELLGQLGRGGMGAVFRARQVSLNRLVALKVVMGSAFQNAEGRARFRAEALAVARLRHPNVVQIYECHPHDDELYFSMELCEGGSLAHWLRHGALAPREAAVLLRTVAEAALAAHEQGIIHRDLTPGNILLARRSGEPAAAERPAEGPRCLAEFVPKISDFGLAKQLGVRLTRTGARMGTPLYMAPEQTVDARAVDHRADIYSLGAILYECLTGQPPFQAPSVLDILDQVRRREPVPVRQLQPGVPRDLETICLKCLRKEPSGRYATARELADDLGRFLAGEPIRARQRSPLERCARWVQRPEQVPFAGKVAVVLYGVLLAWKLLAVILIALGIGIKPRDVGACLVQILVLIGLVNLPQIGLGLAAFKGWRPAPWIGALLSLGYLTFVSLSLSTASLTVGGLLDAPNTRAVVWCLLTIPGSVTLLAYVGAILAHRAGRCGNR